MNISQFLKDKAFALKMLAYRHVYIPYRAQQIRDKDVINVLFVVGNLGAWKSEELYTEMLLHKRFNPTLLIVNSGEEDDRENIRNHAKAKGYKYDELENANVSFKELFNPDIIFFQKPYGCEFIHNLNSLFCYIPYAFHGSTEAWSICTSYIINCWQVYYENEQLAREYSALIGRHVHNSYATGIPAMDEFSIPKEKLNDPWKGNSGKKRIIFAPHHSINPENWWHTSTFLETGDVMLRLAQKYSNQVQWAFKPHPLLRGKLEKIWGKTRTEKYYRAWSDSEWSQYESGKYLELFKYSDAMIHDCGSFTTEYHYTLNPVMYLGHDLDKNPTIQGLNSIQRKALSLHRIGFLEHEIEQFILDIINETDNTRQQRKDFHDTYLISPNRKSTSNNIIECLLSDTYKVY